MEGFNEEEEIDDEEEAKRESHKKKTCQQMIIIHPKKSVSKNIWDTVFYCCLAVSLFFIPYTLAFDTKTIVE